MKKLLMFMLMALTGAPAALWPIPDPVMACGMTASQMAAMAQAAPGENQDPPATAPPADGGDDGEGGVGGHAQPTEFCTPHNRPDGKEPCMCLRQHPEGCKAGKRDVETNICNSWCWKDMCHCCRS